ncbi:SGNH/GDSL hydrolase family protein [uncultured Tenacibaculum sp.]|uniref:SGNH/GDSL hydrolase family protein n=1 Tax=uncultured Tenacibaculum sp. TaxID=174713 RepID=UPI0026068273|nr:SGNH/GDSL hydrolase family protein [uncultured Tenacibaculum sp.]
MKRIILLIIILIQVSVNAQRIMFVGNSLTYSNNMPQILEYIGKQNGTTISTTSICLPNYAIIDHLHDGNVQKQLNKKQYDYILIQQGPSSQAAGKRMLEEDGAKMKTLVSKHQAQLGYFMVWPSVQYYYTFDKVIQNHETAAKKNNALLFPVGKVWKAYNTNKKLSKLYSLDNFHPSKAGSFLAALTIYHKLHPEKSLKELNYKDYSQWISDSTSFHKMIEYIIKEAN